MNLSNLRTLALVLFVLGLVIMPHEAPAQEARTFVAEGLGGARDNLRARDDAIQDALRRAVEQGVGVFVDAATQTRDFETVADQIATRAGGYVRTYRIISEGAEGDLYKVTIEAQVVIGPLLDDLIGLGLTLGRLGHPRVMVMGVERADSADLNSRNVATQIERVMLGNQIPMVDQQFLEMRRARDAAVASASNDYQVAAALGRDFGAEVVIVYEANADYEGGDMIYGQRFERYRGNVTLRVVDVDTAALIVSTTATDIGAAGGREGGARKALENAGKRIGETFFRELLLAWVNKVDRGSALELVLTGVDFNTTNSIYLDVQELRGVNQVAPPQLTLGTTTIRITGTLQGFSLAQRLASNFPNLEIEEVTQNRVKARLKQ